MGKTRIFKGACIGLVIVFVLIVGGLLAFSGSFVGPVPPLLQLPPLSSSSQNAGTASPNGTWVAGAGSLAGFRVGETFLVQSSTIVGRTNGVTGSLVISNNQISSGSFQVDLSQVTFGGKQNASFFKLLETSQYPSATITLTQPVVFQTIPTNGQTISFKAPVSLAIHGITHMVTLTGTARENGSTLEVAGSAPLLASDWNVASPYAVHNDALIEFLLVLHSK